MAKTTGADKVVYRISQWERGYEREVGKALMQQREIIVERMRREHVWENRTSEAERTLTCTLLREGDTFKLIARHGVFYGVYLETMQQGRFAVLFRTMRSQWPRVMQAVRGAAQGVR